MGEPNCYSCSVRDGHLHENWCRAGEEDANRIKLARALWELSKYDYGLADSLSLDVFESWQEIKQMALR